MKRAALSGLLLGGALAAGGCTQNKPSLLGGTVSSLDVQLLDPGPTMLGTSINPVSPTMATFNVTAYDDQRQVVQQDIDVDVYVSYGGVKTGLDTACGAKDNSTPIETAHLHNGVLMNETISLPSAFGSTSLWVEDQKSGATGASPNIFFKNPTIPQVQTPQDITASNAAYCSTFTGKFLTFDTPSAGGQFVVTSVFGDAFAVTDTGASTYNTLYVYLFSQPPDNIVEGAVLDSFSGNYSKFVGFTELSFPLFNVDPTAPLAPVPEPKVLQLSDLTNLNTMLGAAGSVVSYTGTICDPDPPNPTNDPNIAKTDQSWEQFNQFVVDNDGTCDSFSNMAVELPGKVLGTFNPLDVVGQKFTFVGMLQNHSGQNPETDANGNTISCDANNPCSPGTCLNGLCYKGAYNFWDVLPRRQADITAAQ